MEHHISNTETSDIKPYLSKDNLRKINEHVNVRKCNHLHAAVNVCINKKKFWWIAITTFVNKCPSKYNVRAFPTIPAQ